MATMGNVVEVNQVVDDPDLFDLFLNGINQLVGTDIHSLVMFQYPSFVVSFAESGLVRFDSPVVFRIITDDYLPPKMQFDNGMGKRLSLYKGTIEDVMNGEAECLVGSAITTDNKGRVLHRVYYGGTGDPFHYVDLGVWKDLVDQCIALSDGRLLRGGGIRIARD